MAQFDLRLQTHAPLDEAALADLMALHLRVIARLPGGSYRVRGDTSATLADVAALPFSASVTPFQAAEKLDATLAATLQTLATAGPSVAGAADLAAPPVRLLVTLDLGGTAPGITAGAAAARAATSAATATTLQTLGTLGTIVSQSSRRVVLSVPADRIHAVAALHGVLQVEVEPEPRTQNNVARMLTKLEPAATTLALDGAGKIVGVADTGIDTGIAATVLVDFAGRVVNIRATVTKVAFGVANGADLNNHGTHVCGSIAGGGANSNNTIRGMAPAARLTVLSMGPDSSTNLNVPNDLVTGVFADAYFDGARIHSNSWGSNNNLGKYTAFSEDVDDFVWNHRDLLVVIAAGNAGPGASTVAAPGTAKNCLTVGASESVRPLPAVITIDPNIQDDDHNPATPKVNVPLQSAGFGLAADNADDIANFSAHGPVNDIGDNRIKPDIIAPGTFILSCRSSVSIADTGPDGWLHNPNLNAFYADDADGVFTHAEAVGLGLPGEPFFGAWTPNSPAAPAGSGPLAQQNYFYDSGTSMATPITSGTMAVLRQYLRQRRGLANPSAALLKALAVNAASVPAAAVMAPDNTRGFGWLNAQNLLTPTPTGQQTYSDDLQLALATGEIREFSVQVADQAQPLCVTLVWTDLPGKGLQNRLYLRVLPPGNGAAIDGDAGAFPNPTNNVQRVHIPTPVAGVYTVQVHGTAVSFGVPTLLPALRQDFALAVINGLGFSPKPVDVVQVIDHSGSMGFYAFMVPARERAKQFIDVLRINDRGGVVQFDDAAATVATVSPITGLATQAMLKVAIDTIAPAGSTSIGAGLARGVADLAAGGDATHPQAIVLLSDGHENTPPWVGGGVTNSPPAWYGGPDHTEILPTVPASTRIYTVSLGVASDEVLLQDIANARGGLFQAIHSTAEIGKLHEIYVHLQALVGGDEVIAAGSDTVGGIGPAGGMSVPMTGLAPASMRGGSSVGEMLSLAPAGSAAAMAAQPPDKLHKVLVDDTVGSVVFMVSWHVVTRPVTLRLVSPSLKVFTPASTTVQTIRGSSYKLIRIERPEPGEWMLHVQADRADKAGLHAYTWGVHGGSPIGLRLHPPKKALGAKTHALNVIVSDPAKQMAGTLRFAGQLLVPTVSVNDLLKENEKALKAIHTELKPDTPKISPLLTLLPLFDQQRAAKGQPSLFSSVVKKLTLTGQGAVRKGSIATPVAGITGVTVGVSGTTVTGFTFTRVARFDLRC